MIYENVVHLCRENGISITTLEKACGLGNGLIGKWAGNNPRVDNLKKVADYFGVTIDDLMTDQTKPPVNGKRTE